MSFLPCNQSNFNYWLNFVCFDDSEAKILSKIGLYICVFILMILTYLLYGAIRKDKRIRSPDDSEIDN